MSLINHDFLSMIDVNFPCWNCYDLFIIKLEIYMMMSRICIWIIYDEHQESVHQQLLLKHGNRNIQLILLFLMLFTNLLIRTFALYVNLIHCVV